MKEHPLYKIANPDSIAILGASNNFMSMGTSVLSSIQALNFKGPIYPVHPREKSVLGLTAYSSVEELPEVPDLAVIVLPTRIVVEAMDACGKKGIRHAIVVSGGFGESGENGIDMQKQLKETAKSHGIRFLGPNCIGAVNPHHHFNATFLTYGQKPGFIGMASQSGSFITQMFDYLDLFGLGFSTGFSVGNEADTDIVDCMEYLAQCPNTRVIGLYIESIRRGDRFIEAARRIAPDKPVVAYYAGGTEAGRRAGFSHTGSLAGPDRVYDGVFRQGGIIRAYSIEELYDFCWCLGTCPIPAGNRVLVQTHSGGPGAVAADACDRAGLVLPTLADETRNKLAEILPHTASMNNPVDLTFTRDPRDYTDVIPRLLAADDNTDAVLMYMLQPPSSVRRAVEAMGVKGGQVEEEVEKYMDGRSREMARFIKGCEKPFIGFSYATGENRFIRGLYDAGVPVFPSPNRAARAAWALVEYARLKEKIVCCA
ncbi:MAG: CoA-binding protein [Desulfosalsimonadaceae bacterium]